MLTSRLDVIVAGAGRVGFRVARLLKEADHSVTIVEKDPQRCEELSDEYVATIIRGDASDPDVLRQADPQGADVIAALTGNGSVNLGVIYTATHLADDVRTVVRIDHERSDAIEELADAVVFPERLGALGATNEIVGADVRALEDVTGDLRIMEVVIGDDAPIANRLLSEVSLPHGSLIVSGGDGDLIAHAETELRPGEQYVVAVEPDVVDEVLNLMRG
jgi:trk system potassium uptake protein TrkA